MKQNCWEYNNCGAEVGGKREAEFGTCAVALYEQYNGKNGGKNAGRYCWQVMGTLCFGRLEKTHEETNNSFSCIDCKFYQKVQQEEGVDFICQEGKEEIRHL